MASKIGFQMPEPAEVEAQSSEAKTLDEAIKKSKQINVVISVNPPNTPNIIRAIAVMNKNNYRLMQAGINQGTSSTGELLMVFERVVTDRGLKI